VSRAGPRIVVATAPNPGAIGVVQLFGTGAAQVLEQLTGQSTWRPGSLRLADFGGIDEGLAVLLRADWAQLMPHGGPRVIQKLVTRLLESGAVYDSDPPARQVYPEAECDCQADMLALLAKAASPAAIDLLLAQPSLWRQWVQEHDNDGSATLARSARWQQLIVPPAVVVVGQPNVGKSTLSNQLLGRQVSVVADLPGTTRDWVAGLAALGRPDQAVAVRWLDTPGLRQSEDAIEQAAIKLARSAIDQATLLIAMRDTTSDWPQQQQLPRVPQLYLQNKVDEQPDHPGGGELGSPLLISALHGLGLDHLERLVLKQLGLDDLNSVELWAFSANLRAAVESNDRAALRSYVGV
jgi:small GTP-binding protein